MQTWNQIYMPLGGLGLSALAAAVPVIFFFIALAVMRMKGHVAGAITLGLTLAISIVVYRMPADMAFAAAGYGFAYGLWPIAWIIVAAVFLYKITVKTGQFDIIRASVLSGLTAAMAMVFSLILPDMSRLMEAPAPPRSRLRFRLRPPWSGA